MKTKLMYFLVFALLLLPVACGEKEVPPQEYTANEITLMVPGTWQASYEAPQQQIMLAAPNDEYALGIQILATGNASAEMFAQAMADQLDGEAIEPAAKYGDYQFDCKIMGFPANIIILEKDGYSLVLIQVGDHAKFAAQAESVIKSMKSSKLEFQNVIGAIKY